LGEQCLYITHNIGGDITGDVMFSQLAEMKEITLEDIEKFRKKGAISREKAMSIEDLGLSSEFKCLMEGHLGLLSIFIGGGWQILPFRGTVEGS
jgi:hypothetical protein